MHTLVGHTGRITSVAISPDGQSAATAAWDATVRLWDLKSGKEIHRIDFPDTDGFKAKVDQIAFSPDNAFLVAVQREPTNAGFVVVWKRKGLEKVHQLPGSRFAISADSKHIACSNVDENSVLIQVYELANGELAQEMEGPYSRVDLLTFAPDGKTIYGQINMPRPPPEKGASRGRDGAQVRTWDVPTGNERKSPLEGAWHEPLLTFAPDGRSLAVRDLYSSQSITLRETATSGPRVVLAGHTDDVTDVAFAPDGRTLASASMDKTVRLWDLPSGM